MRVELLYFDGCPNWAVAEERLKQALKIVGQADTGVEHRLVETVDQAVELGFMGSPTIRIDGTDPFAQGTEQVGLACRLFATPSGFEGAPTTEQLVEALRGGFERLPWTR